MNALSSPKTANPVPKVRYSTLFAVIAGLCFWLFFQISKFNVFHLVNPFANDPYDLVGSIAVEAAWGIGLLSLARLIQQARTLQPSRDKLRFILRGNLLIVMAIGITVITYLLAILQNPAPLSKSVWGDVLIGGLCFLSVMAVVAGVAAGTAWHSLMITYPDSPKSSTFMNGMLYEAVTDILFLLWIPVAWLITKRSSTQSMLQRLARLKERSLWRGLMERSWVSPVRHPWRFVALAAVGIGGAYFLVHVVFEGYSPDVYATLTLLLIGLVVETVAILSGFALFGAFLGLRPPLQQSLVQNEERPISTLRLLGRIGLRIVVIFWGVVFIGAVTFTLFLWLQHNRSVILPEPTGPYRIGRIEYEWQDETRLELSSDGKNAPRELPVWIWYPASPSKDAKPAIYVPDNWSQAVEKERGAIGTALISQNLADVEVHAVADAPVMSADRPFPILIMQPGLGPIATDYTTLAEDLASHGYVVIASTPIDVVLPDGQVIQRPGQNTIADDAPPDVANTFYGKLVSSWAADNIFVMNQLEKLNTADSLGKFTGRLDIHAIGVWGHSLGGASAAETCKLDDRCKAGVDLDGTLFGDVVQGGLHQPFMFIWSEPKDPKDESYQQTMRDAQTVYDTLQQGAYQLTVTGAAHFNFSDYAVENQPFLRLIGGIGTIDGRRGLRISGDYLVAFFDKYLKGVNAPLMNGASPAYPEVQFQSR